MKITEYRCDRCKCTLGSDGEASEHTGFVLDTKTYHFFRFYKNWEEGYRTRTYVEHNLCEDCRKDLDRWLEGDF